MSISIFKQGYNPSTMGSEKTNDSTSGTSASLSGVIGVVNEKSVRQEVVEQYFPGYLDDKHQDLILDSKFTYKYAQHGWKEQNYLKFRLNVGERSRYNPSTEKLILRIK